MGVVAWSALLQIVRCPARLATPNVARIGSCASLALVSTRGTSFIQEYRSLQTFDAVVCFRADCAIACTFLTLSLSSQAKSLMALSANDFLFGDRADITIFLSATHTAVNFLALKQRGRC